MVAESSQQAAQSNKQARILSPPIQQTSGMLYQKFRVFPEHWSSWQYPFTKWTYPALHWSGFGSLKIHNFVIEKAGSDIFHYIFSAHNILFIHSEIPEHTF